MLNFKQLLATLTLTAGFFAAAGCGNHPRPPIEPNSVQYGDYKQLYVASYRLKQDTNIDSPPTLQSDEFGLLHVTVPIRSVIDRPFTVQYRVTFFNHDQQMVNQQDWSDKPLTPNTPDQIQVNSPVPAEDFRMDLRLAPGFSR